jgi:hypothetical protein
VFIDLARCLKFYPLCDTLGEGTISDKDGLRETSRHDAAYVATVGGSRQIVNCSFGMQGRDAAFLRSPESIANPHARFLGVVVAWRVQPAAIIGVNPTLVSSRAI